MFNWEAIGTALHANPKPRQHFITKLTTGFLGVGKWMKHWVNGRRTSAHVAGYWRMRYTWSFVQAMGRMRYGILL